MCCTYLKLIRIITWMRRFITNSNNPILEGSYSNLNVETIKSAEMLLLKNMQWEVFASINNAFLKRLHFQLYEEDLNHMTSRRIHKKTLIESKVSLLET